MMISKAEAIRLRGIIETAVATAVDDQTASTTATLFPKYKTDGSLLEAGKRINWNGVVKRAAVDLWQTKENNPDNNPDLWEDIQYKDGYRIIPMTITAAGAFALNELGWWKGVLYKSKLEANVWTPEVNPDGWEMVE